MKVRPFKFHLTNRSRFAGEHSEANYSKQFYSNNLHNKIILTKKARQESLKRPIRENG